MIDLRTMIEPRLGNKRRTTPQGWTLYNARCCAHRGHRPDTRMRGNIRFVSDGTLGGNCYNCGFKFRFDGRSISDSFEQWLKWMGVEHSDIQKLKLALLALHMSGELAPVQFHAPVLAPMPEVDLPQGAENIISLMENGCRDDHFLEVINYLNTRGSDILAGYDYHWSSSSQNQLSQRVIIPFHNQDQIVGWTARYAGTPPRGVPKYWNSQLPAGYLFNQNVLSTQRQFVLISEGPFDAIATQGVATLGSTMSDLQIQNLLQYDQQPIVVPDRQGNNQQLIDIALSFGWAVSLPDWEDHIKDCADACAAYGQLYTITSALAARTHNSVEISIKRQMFRG